jgi:glutamate carboxypeptidase
LEARERRRWRRVNPILKYLEVHREDMLEDLKQFVEKETPSTNKPLLDAFAEFLAGYAGTVAGGRAEVLPAEVSGNNVRVHWGREDGGPPLFLLGHYDTVWSEGTLEKIPFGVADGIATGPGSST